MMLWPERPEEEARLLNPAFLGLLVRSAAAGYKETSGKGIPMELAFVALPVTLHKTTREALPRSVRTSLATWLMASPQCRIGFAERARGLAPFVREAILFGAAHGLLDVADGGQLVPCSRLEEMAAYLHTATDEARECVRRAEFLGRWFGGAGTPATILALWGVTV